MRLVLLTLLFFTACSAGNDKVLEPELRQHFKPGITTRYEVETLYGRPQQVETHDDGGECWVYLYQGITTNPHTYIPLLGVPFGNPHSDVETLNFTFDAEGMLQGVDMGAYTVDNTTFDASTGKSVEK